MTTPIYTTTGNFQVDRSVVPYIRHLPVIVRGYNLRPYTNANYWFDDVKINNYVQPASFITVGPGYRANIFQHEEGIYCTNTHAYAVVCENSQGTILHIDENYTCANISIYGPGGSNTFSSTDYAVNDIVYQANNTANVYANTMMGRVVYWNSTDGALSISIDSGTLSNTALNNVVFKVGSTKRANVINVVMGDKFPIGSTIKSVTNPSNFFIANTYTHNHGVVSVVVGAANQIRLSGKLTAGHVGKLIYLCSGYGIGQYASIISVDTVNMIATLNTSWVGHYGNTYYGIGSVVVDDIGFATGIFRIPEDNNLKFQTGSRLVTINDGISHVDNTASMRATTTFTASGAIGGDTTGTPVVTPNPPMSSGDGSTTTPSDPTSKSAASSGVVNNPAASADPLVQTFFTPKPNTQKPDYGIFASSVDLFFQNKPSGSSTLFPISVYIVNTKNGFPTTDILSTATVRCEDVNLTDGITTFPDSANSSTLTKFTFPDPVYLAPGTEYGIVVYSESPDYEIWISQFGDTLLNSQRLVSQSPYLGSFYKSQNASAWTPIQNQQLMFTLNKAQFSNQAVSLFFNVTPPVQNTFMDSVMVHSSDVTFPVANITYGVSTTIANTGATDAGYRSLEVNSPYSFGEDLSNSSLNSNRRRLIAAGNANSCVVQITMSTSDPDVSPMFHSERISLLSVSNFINAGGLSPMDISILTPGNHMNVSNVVVSISAPTGEGAVQATANVSLTGNSVSAINIINPGAGYVVSPTITISEAGAPANATAQVYGEDGKFGGNSLARYVTRSITLADGFDAGDITVFLNAIRPQGTDVNVYYKVLSGQDTDQLTNKNWKLMSKKVDVFSPDRQTSVALTYNTGTLATGQAIGSVSYVENGITYPIGGKFKTFAIKIVMNAGDPTVSPVVQNFRAVAIPSG